MRKGGKRGERRELICTESKQWESNEYVQRERERDDTYCEKKGEVMVGRVSKGRTEKRSEQRRGSEEWRERKKRKVRDEERERKEGGREKGWLAET